ncbi:MAG: glycosyltransferase family 2 protein [Lachnospiraceae bacterium]|nr:glycosyltransferase family 2 protein [Lachnospiraceae bacterium]
MVISVKKISIVIPLYNSQDIIERVLDSLKNQTRIDLVKEIIIVNDGSKDNSEEVVLQYAKQNENLPIRVITKENGGVSTARNRGIAEATGEWVALEDSDDIWHPRKLELQWEYINKYSDIYAIGGNRDGELVKFGQQIDEGLYRMSCLDYLIKNWPHTSTLLIKKEVFDEVGVFDETMTHAEDGDLFMRIAYRYGLYYTYESLENCGDGKATFGESGLSRDIKKMHIGVNRMFKKAKRLKYINVVQYVLLVLYEKLKYWRRCLIVRSRK